MQDFSITENIVAVIRFIGNNFTNFANIASIAGLVITIFTLRNTTKIKEAIIARDEEQRFKEGIHKSIERLESLNDSLKDGVYSVQLLTEVREIVEEISIFYPSVTKSIRKELMRVEKLVDECMEHRKEANYKKQICINSFSHLIAKLKKLEMEASVQ